MGRWVASSSDLSTKTEWRIEGNQWHMYLRFEPGVPYADAELVVLAIRHSQLLNRLPTDNSPLKLRPYLPVVDPTDISFMEVCGTEPRTYNVHTGKSKASCEILTVKIKDGKVELHQL